MRYDISWHDTIQMWWCPDMCPDHGFWLYVSNSLFHGLWPYMGTILRSIYTIMSCMHAQRVSGRGLNGVPNGAPVEMQSWVATHGWYFRGPNHAKWPISCHSWYVTIFGYPFGGLYGHNDLYARPEGLQDMSRGVQNRSKSVYTGVSSYSRVVFQVSRWPDLGPFHDVWKWVQNRCISCIWRVPETSWDMIS